MKLNLRPLNIYIQWPILISLYHTYMENYVGLKKVSDTFPAKGLKSVNLYPINDCIYLYRKIHLNTELFTY